MVMNRKYLGALFICFSLLVISCAPEDTPTPTATDERDKIIGTYTCEETENGNSVTTFDISIRKTSTKSDTVLIDNFYNIGNQYKVIGLYSNNSLRISTQNVSSFGFQGEGTFNGSNKISFTYKATVGGTANNCTAIATKQ